ncbi:AAA family ATPase [Bacteroides heparinolyticus]|uniref:AAA family ATPase n=1 Tax=Prevotella heparinolytica TaxID=28113 RepID=UPI003FA0B096
MKIKSIKIERLYDKYNFEWELRKDVNILAGDNGSYKTTLLKIIAALCEPDYIPEVFGVKSASANMYDDVNVKYRSFRDSLLRLKKESESDELLNELATKISADINGQDDKSLADHTINASIIAIRQNGNKIAASTFKQDRNYSLIATFDVPTKTENGSALDQQLEKLESEYAYYLSDLSKQLSDIIRSAGKVELEDMRRIYAQNNLFIEIVNHAFANTQKVVDTEQSKLQFKLEGEVLDNNKKLSSGEKQFLIVMLTVLLQRKEESILIMDEPEISMHIDWQRELLNNLKKLNPNCQIILATHSPGVVMDGWEQLVTNISSLMTRVE